MQYFSASVNVKKQPGMINQQICVKKLIKKKTAVEVLQALGFQLANGKPLTFCIAYSTVLKLIKTTFSVPNKITFYICCYSSGSFFAHDLAVALSYPFAVEPQI